MTEEMTAANEALKQRFWIKVTEKKEKEGTRGKCNSTSPGLDFFKAHLPVFMQIRKVF